MPTKAESRTIDGLVDFYQEKTSQETLSIVREQVLVAIRDSDNLKPHIHSLKTRLKGPKELRSKLLRKLKDANAKNLAFEITPDNLFVKVGDLIGIRILHLHTRQFEAIDKALRDIFKERKYRLAERPFARTWDDEYRGYFRSLGIKVEASPTMYTSVHYSIEPISRTKIRCEIQVRTLMEEVWGEVDHTFNYPDPIESIGCAEQIKALARVTSSATRLVDSIFASAGDFAKSRQAGRKRS